MLCLLGVGARVLAATAISSCTRRSALAWSRKLQHSGRRYSLPRSINRAKI